MQQKVPLGRKSPPGTQAINELQAQIDLIIRCSCDLHSRIRVFMGGNKVGGESAANAVNKEMNKIGEHGCVGNFVEQSEVTNTNSSDNQAKPSSGTEELYYPKSVGDLFDGCEEWIGPAKLLPEEMTDKMPELKTPQEKVDRIPNVQLDDGTLISRPIKVRPMSKKAKKLAKRGPADPGFLPTVLKAPHGVRVNAEGYPDANGGWYNGVGPVKSTFLSANPSLPVFSSKVVDELLAYGILRVYRREIDSYQSEWDPFEKQWDCFHFSPLNTRDEKFSACYTIAL